ncbi:MAG: sporulation integral membrane protein YlbJ, partial [Peptococcaceae bacterium]|nr:sporulation integral membrane protein YlbJ [Peptococcaceae bacterium]
MKRFSELFFMLLVLILTLLMLFYPEAAYEGACRGLSTWATHLLPSLLPFFIVADLLLSMGFVRFLGILFEPVMRPLFRLPGEAGFALALGFTSGFPMGAILTSSLKEQ